MRIFGSEKLKGLMGTLGMTDDEAIEHTLINRSIGQPPLWQILTCPDDHWQFTRP